MTRASLLRILDNLGGISETEVQELEQLAAAFPYCQTAHLLLAKAAHDRGSMLAAQRLRRAATYAVDRQRLRTLIELPAPFPPALLAAPTDATRVATTPVLLQIAPQVGAVVVEEAPLEVVEVLEIETTADNHQSEPDGTDNQSVEASDSTPEVQESHLNTTVTATAANALDEAAEQLPTEDDAQPDSAVTFAKEVEVTENTPASEQSVSAEPLTREPEAAQEYTPLSATVEVTPEPAMPPVPEVEPETEVGTNQDNKSTAEAGNDAALMAPVFVDVVTVLKPANDEMPTEVAPIRPPAEVGSSRFEFGLAETVPAVSTYNLFDVEKAPAKSTFAMPSFWADAEVGYAPGLGSRLGFCLQAQDEYTLDLPPSAFFAPDALLLQHLKQHQPVPPPVPKSIDLIDKFLRSKPRFKAPLPLPPTTEAQADLSVRSTVAEPGLASESLARIMARQGKIAKAIEIYERLMVRQPEKKAYFADRIQQLQTFE